jgi:hypothetical protein
MFKLTVTTYVRKNGQKEFRALGEPKSEEFMMKKDAIKRTPYTINTNLRDNDDRNIQVHFVLRIGNPMMGIPYKIVD